MLPNLIIAGPHRSGTTTLFNWLRAHPDAHASIKKETLYFADRINSHNRNNNFITHDLESYPNLFTGYEGQKIVFEASPGYLFAKNAIDNISRLNSKPKLLFMYRDPVERLVSLYNFSRYKTKTFKRDFISYTGWDGRNFSGTYFENGRIVTLINQWIDRYPDQVFVFDFLDLVKKPTAFMTRLSNVLEIDPSFYETYSFQKKNDSFKVKNRRLQVLAVKADNALPDYIKGPLIKLYRGINTEKVPGLTKEEQEMTSRLKAAYSDQIPEKLKSGIYKITE